VQGHQEQQRQVGTRARFAVPHCQQQQRQQPKTPLDLGLRSSPTIDDLLKGGEVGAGAGLAALPGSPAEQARPSQRLWLPQRAAPQLQQEEEGQGPLVSPAGPAFLQQQQQPQGGEGGVTPGAPLDGMQACGRQADAWERDLASHLPYVEVACPAGTPAKSARQQGEPAKGCLQRGA
jgi:hypothetical protein